MNFIRLKKIFIFALAAPAIFLIVANILLLSNKPDIRSVETPDINDFTFDSAIESSVPTTDQNMNIPSFDFELIGFRSGDVDSSVILKKGNKEFVIAKGEKIDGVYELIEVNKEEVIFRNNEKLYKIKNRLGK
jgi:type II secretory pathway component PulC|tara:strand:- start:2730 stop:3128 length:399 start_codon:yes stop_codon:yes gene_type:complete